MTRISKISIFDRILQYFAFANDICLIIRISERCILDRKFKYFAYAVGICLPEKLKEAFLRDNYNTLLLKCCLGVICLIPRIFERRIFYLEKESRNIGQVVYRNKSKYIVSASEGQRYTKSVKMGI